MSTITPAANAATVAAVANPISFLRDRESRSFKSIEDLKDFLTAREGTDQWRECPQGFVTFTGLDKCPIMAATMPTPINYEGDEDSIREAMTGQAILVSFFDTVAQKWRSMPLRYTAFPGVLERARVGGRTFTECVEEETADTSVKVVLPPRRKAELLTEFFKLWGDSECKMLVRDGKMSTLRSKAYEELLSSELIGETLKEVESVFGSYTFEGAEVDHERTILKVSFPMAGLEDALTKAGVSFKTARGGVTFASSDVGNLAATLVPVANIDGEELQLGEVQKMEHLRSAGLSLWKEKLEHLATLEKATAKRVSDLCNTEIANAAGCLRSIACEKKLNRLNSLKIASDMDAMYGEDGCTAFDVYRNLVSIIKQAKSKVSSTARQLDILSSSAEMLLVDYTANDIEFEWKEG